MGQARPGRFKSEVIFITIMTMMIDVSFRNDAPKCTAGQTSKKHKILACLLTYSLGLYVYGKPGWQAGSVQLTVVQYSTVQYSTSLCTRLCSLAVRLKA